MGFLWIHQDDNALGGAKYVAPDNSCRQLPPLLPQLNNRSENDERSGNALPLPKIAPGGQTEEATKIL
jgi:hypothetical protein